MINFDSYTIILSTYLLLTVIPTTSGSSKIETSAKEPVSCSWLPSSEGSKPNVQFCSHSTSVSIIAVSLYLTVVLNAFSGIFDSISFYKQKKNYYAL